MERLEKQILFERQLPMRYTTSSRNSNEPRRTKQCIGVAGVVLLTKQSFPATAMIAVVRRSTNTAIDALAIPVLDQTDLRRDVNPQRERLMLR